MSTLAPSSAAELAILRSALPANEPVKSYAPGSAARREIKAALSGLRTERREMPLVIGGVRVRTGRLEPAIVPHDHRHVLGEAHMAGPVEVERAIAAALVMEILIEAGLPPGVINLVYGDPAEVARACLAHRALAGVHFTGSTAVFNGIVRSVGQGIDRYATYPRLVGETGGKNFVLLHASADVAAATAAIVRGAFEYQGQKCSAASRLYVPRSLWGALRQRLCEEIASIKVGDVADFRNFMGAVIDQRAWQRHVDAIAAARSAAAVLAGGNASSEIGYFVEPTLIQTDDLGSPLLQEELFGPIATAFVYEDGAFAALIDAIDGGGRYGLTGAIFAQDRAAIRAACDGLRDAAGNFYINDKPTGAVVGQQPFGGARSSGTNDKAGSMWNLIRWSSPRAIKETFDPPRDYRYPFLGPFLGDAA